MLDWNAKENKISLRVLRPRSFRPHQRWTTSWRHLVMLARTRRHHARVHHIMRHRSSHAHHAGHGGTWKRRMVSWIHERKNNVRVTEPNAGSVTTRSLIGRTKQQPSRSIKIIFLIFFLFSYRPSKLLT